MEIASGFAISIGHRTEYNISRCELNRIEIESRTSIKKVLYFSHTWKKNTHTHFCEHARMWKGGKAL